MTGPAVGEEVKEEWQSATSACRPASSQFPSFFLRVVNR